MRSVHATTRPTEAAPPASALRHLRPRDRIGLWFLAGALASTALALWLAASGSIVLWGVGQLLLAVGLVQWFVLLHECGHGTLFRTRWLHVLVGHVSGVLAGIPYLSWKWIHARHHKWTGWQDVDPTTTSLVPRELGRLERQLVNFCWRTWLPLFAVVYRLNNFWNLPRLRRLFRRSSQQRALTANLLWQATLYVVLIVVVGPVRLMQLCGVGVFVSLVFQEALILSQHTHIPQRLSEGRKVSPHKARDQEVFTRSLRFPRWFSTGILMNLDAHELHHMYPFVPSYTLRRIGYRTRNEIDWWAWLRAAHGVPGEVFLFQNRDDTELII